MQPYGHDGPFDRRKSGGWPRMVKRFYRGFGGKAQTVSDKSMYRWFKRIARRYGKQQIKEQQDC